MADPKQAFTVELVAGSAGFYANRRIRPGQSFTFTGTAIPKWAAPAGEVAKLVERKVKQGDTKPKTAQAAVKIKTGAGSADAA